MILQPLAQVAIYSIVLSALLSAKLPPGHGGQFSYAIYLIAGMVPWSLFTEVMARSLTMFVDNAGLMKKIAFPRICIPVVMVGGALINHALLLLATLVVILVSHQPITLLALWIPLLTAVLLVFGVALGLILGVVNVFVRDVGQVMNVILQLWFWMTPIVYVVDILPAQFKHLAIFNPVTPVVQGYQNVLLFQQAPPFTPLFVLLAASFVLLGFSLYVFRKASPELVDVL
ncbi:ABC transporter permease [Luteibacter anthropi]|uniref:ABC transporter permease n=1 Tax=Luteibacter anthropi TaxID=564369 RepID=UPI0020327605|nr:ABC transporter permease [Luteibacter anthropi]